jgi:phospho-N-acetylmuramoyl-pentapeptide-transferase
MLYNLLQLMQNWLDEIGLYSVVQVLNQLHFRAFSAVVIGFVIVLLFGRTFIRWLLTQKIGDNPEFYHKDLNELMASKSATPTMGGLLICGSVFITSLLLADLTNQYVRLGLVVLIWLAAVGGVDDWLKLTSARRNPGSREGLYAWEKLLFQLGIGFLAGIFLYRFGLAHEVRELVDSSHALTLPFQRTYDPHVESPVLQAGVIVLPGLAFVFIATMLLAGTSNAVNLTDGMDGLAPGTLAVASFALMVLCYIAGNFEAAMNLRYPHVPGTDELMIITGAMAGACLGFLWFNCPPAMVFMGDTGSLPLGGMLAYIAVAIRQEFLLLIIGGVFFWELASVIIQVGYFKYSRGKRVFLCSPIHHHFHLKGWSEQQVVIRFWLVAVMLAMVALVSLKLR